MLADNKTQTRRVADRLIKFGKVTEFGMSDTPGYDWCFRDKRMRWNDISNERLLEYCPYGQPGGRLWVKETWMPVEHDVQPCRYRATNPSYIGKWKSPMFMPRRFSRVLLDITNIRIERLLEISEADAKAEGIHYADTGLNQWGQQRPGWSWKRPHPMNGDHCLGSARLAYGNLWNTLHGEDSWDTNPYVWVIEFKRIES